MPRASIFGKPSFIIVAAAARARLR